LKKLVVSLALVFLCSFAVSLHAQQVDTAFGFGTLTAPSGTNGFPSESGGLFVNFGANFILKHHIGFGAEVASRVRRAPYGVTNGSVFLGSIPYRPIFYDFNAVYGVTSIKRKIGGDLMAGIGAENLRFYTGSYSCNGFGCTNYQSSNHFAWHFGGDVRFYFWGHAFIRPEAHYYVVHNNWEFNNVNVSRFAVSIGYSFTPGF
jgi:hypothetical protein